MKKRRLEIRKEKLDWEKVHLGQELCWQGRVCSQGREKKQNKTKQNTLVRHEI